MGDGFIAAFLLVDVINSFLLEDFRVCEEKSVVLMFSNAKYSSSLRQEESLLKENFNGSHQVSPLRKLLEINKRSDGSEQGNATIWLRGLLEGETTIYSEHFNSDLS